MKYFAVLSLAPQELNLMFLALVKRHGIKMSVNSI
jgi:hypothetical protein